MNDGSGNEKSLISEDLIVDGNVDSAGMLEISGKVNGHVSATNLRLEVNGKIKGNVKAESADILGHQHGKVTSKKLTIHSGAVLKGAVNCQDLVVESGASISGKFQVKAN